MNIFINLEKTLITHPLGDSRALGSHGTLKMEAGLVFGLFTAALLSACPLMSGGTFYLGRILRHS